MNPRGRAGRPEQSVGRCDHELARRGARRHRRGDAAQPDILYFGEGTGERGGTFAHTKGLWQEFGPTRMVDTPISEQGFTGAAHRRLGHRHAHRGGPDVRRFHVRGGGPDRAAGGQAALHEQRPDERADGGACRRRRRAQRRPASQRHLPPDVGARSRPDRLHALDAGRRQGPDEDGATRRRPRA